MDWWTLGVLLYEMLTGLPPFYDENTNEMYRKILQEPLTFPSSDIVPPAARDLLTRLLDRDPQRRLGATGAAEIKSHHFFANIDWRKLLQRKYEPSFRPSVVCTSQDLIAAFLVSIYILTILFRLMPLTRTTLTASSLPRLPRTHMSMARPCRQPCSNSSSGGRITDRLQVSVTPVVVSRIPPSAASPSKSRTSAGCLHQLDRVWCARRDFIEMILPLYRVFCLGPHITPILIISISVLVLSFLCCFFHPKESVASWSRSLIPSSRDKSLSVLSFFPPSNPKSYVPLSALVLSSF